jgi:hypothetical protein
MVDVDGERAEPRTDEPPAKDPAGERVVEGGHVCNVAFCPIGLALSAVQPMKPDVIEHLLLAGREFFLAAKAVLDARADELKDDGVSPTLEKIDIG